LKNYFNEHGRNVYSAKVSKCKLYNIARDKSSGGAQLRTEKAMILRSLK